MREEKETNLRQFRELFSTTCWYCGGHKNRPCRYRAFSPRRTAKSACHSYIQLVIIFKLITTSIHIFVPSVLIV